MSLVRETIRQGIRRLMGAPAATGNVQRLLDLDPESRAASGAGIAAEALTAGGGEAALSGVARGLQSYAPKLYAELFGPKSKAVRDELAQKIVPVFEDLPMGGRGHIEKVATEQAKGAGKKVAELYNVDVPSNFSKAIDELQALEKGQVRTPGHFTEQGGKKVWVDPDIKDPALHSALKGRRLTLGKAEDVRESFGEPMTVQDVFEARKTADEMARRAKKSIFTPGGVVREETPRSQALIAERTGHAKTLHEAIPGGKEADAAFSAWKTVEKGAKRDDPGTFPVRWMISRMIGGQVGTAAGFLATKPAFWSSVGAKGAMRLGKLLQAGDETGAAQLARTFIDTYTNAHPEEE
jgi:hypothetical protein